MASTTLESLLPLAARQRSLGQMMLRHRNRASQDVCLALDKHSCLWSNKPCASSMDKTCCPTLFIPRLINGSINPRPKLNSLFQRVQLVVALLGRNAQSPIAPCEGPWFWSPNVLIACRPHRSHFRLRCSSMYAGIGGG